MRRRVGLAVVVSAIGCAAGAHGAIRVVGHDIVVTTPRYDVTLRDGAVVTLVNKLTRETYTRTDDPAEWLRKLPTGLGCPRPTMHEPYRKRNVQDVMDMHWPSDIKDGAKAADKLWMCQHKPWPGSTVRTRVLGPDHVRVTYEGLWDAVRAKNKAELDRCRGRRFEYPRESFTLDVRVDPKTHDLVMRPTVRSPYPGICGVAWSVANLRGDMRIVLPVLGGVELMPDHPLGTRTHQWPMFWDAALWIGRTDKGSFAVWAEDKTLRVKYIQTRHGKDSWHMTMESCADPPFGRFWELAGVDWRLNVFDTPDWRAGCDRYAEWMKRSWPLVPIEKQTPSWVKDIRFVRCDPAPEHIDPATVLVYHGRPAKDWGSLPGDEWSPGWPPENPTHYEFADTVVQKTAKAHKVGAHCMAWLPFSYANACHPIIAKFWRYRLADWFWPKWGFEDRHICVVHSGVPEWRRTWIGWLEDLHKRYKMDAFNADVNFIGMVNRGGEVNGMNTVQGTALQYREARDALPQVALSGEYTNEMVLPWMGLSRWSHGVRWGPPSWRDRHRKHSLPIRSYLYSPYSIPYIDSTYKGPGFHDFLDWVEATGVHIPYGKVGTLSELGEQDALLLIRAMAFDKHRLVPHWPKVWDPKVKFYWESRHGPVFAYVRDRGSKFVNRTAGKTLYWRIRGTTTVEAPGGIRRWIAYSGKRIIGLNPKSGYIYLDEPRDTSFVIDRLPEGTYLDSVRRYDRFIVANLRPTDDKPRPGTVSFKSQGPVHAVVLRERTLQSVGRAFTVKTTAPNTMVFLLKEPTRIAASYSLLAEPLATRMVDTNGATNPDFDYAHMRLRKRKDHLYAHSVHLGQTRMIDYVLAVPADGPNLAVRCALEVGERAVYGGCTFAVYINGMRRQRVAVDRGARRELAVSLKPFRGRTILVSLAESSKTRPDSRGVCWYEPRIVAAR